MVKFQELTDYFERFDQACKGRGINGKTTAAGTFVPSSLDHVGYVMKELRKRGAINHTKPFLDAGSGDGRVVALTALLGIPSYGIEDDPALANRGTRNLEKLRRLGILNGTEAKIADGNFDSDEAYRKLGLQFREIGTVFNFVNGDDVIARKIQHESPKGTVFIVFGFKGYGHNYPGLKTEERFVLSHLARTDVVPEPVYAHVCRKAS